MKNIKSSFINLGLIMISIVIGMLIVEAGLRGYFWAKSRVSTPPARFEGYLGWQTTPNLRNTQVWPGYGEVQYSSGPYGFRVFGDVNTDKMKILVIGDSFTNARQISDGKVYYNYLQQLNPQIELFAYGGGGYGTLQEFMVLEKYYNEIKPDLILWQFCGNDLINNSHALESISLLHNNLMICPYYNRRKDKIEWLFPDPDHGWFGNFINQSYVLKMLKINRNIHKNESDQLERHLTADDPLLIESVETTKAIMAKVKQKASGTPIVAFAALLDEISAVRDETFAGIAASQGIGYIDNINPGLTRLKKEGVAIDGFQNGGDEHWNETGHRLVGELIYDYLVDHNFILEGER